MKNENNAIAKSKIEKKKTFENVHVYFIFDQ